MNFLKTTVQAVQADSVTVACQAMGEHFKTGAKRPPSQFPEILHRALASQAVPNLWIPRTVIQVAQLPALASGKLGLAACLKLAKGAVTVR